MPGTQRAGLGPRAGHVDTRLKVSATACKMVEGHPAFELLP
jgi:hypothetical protein